MSVENECNGFGLSRKMVERLKDSLNWPASIPGPISPDILRPVFRRRVNTSLVAPEIKELIEAYKVKPYKSKREKGARE